MKAAVLLLSCVEFVTAQHHTWLNVKTQPATHGVTLPSIKKATDFTYKTQAAALAQATILGCSGAYQTEDGSWKPGIDAVSCLPKEVNTLAANTFYKGGMYNAKATYSAYSKFDGPGPYGNYNIGSYTLRATKADRQIDSKLPSPANYRDTLLNDPTGGSYVGEHKIYYGHYQNYQKSIHANQHGH